MSAVGVGGAGGWSSRRRQAWHPWLSALVVLIGLGGCVPRYGIVQREDPFFETYSRRMRGNGLAAVGSGRDWVALGAEEVRTGRDSTLYHLVLDVRSPDRALRVRTGESLILLVDSVRTALTPAGATEQDESVWGERETVRYPVQLDLLRKIAAARQVRVRVVGRRYYLDREMTPANLRRFRRFLKMQELGEEPRPDSISPGARGPRTGPPGSIRH